VLNCNPVVGAYEGFTYRDAVVVTLDVTAYEEYDDDIAENTYEAVAAKLEYEAVTEYEADVILPYTPADASTEPDTTELFFDINPLRVTNSFGIIN
jgi:hypothetical protein